VVIDALDRVSVQLELGHDGGREVNPAGVQLGKSDRLLGGLTQPLEQRCCWASASVIDRIVPSDGISGASDGWWAAAAPSGRPRIRHPPQQPMNPVTPRQPRCGWRPSQIRYQRFQPSVLSSSSAARFRRLRSPRLRSARSSSDQPPSW
jgi:hypothetical protein